MRLRAWAYTILSISITITSTRADEVDRAKEAVTRAEAALKRLTALRGKGLASDIEVRTAEFQAQTARAVLARVAGDDKEEDYREAAVAAADDILKRFEEFQKKGITPADEVDTWRRAAAAARIELAALRGQQKVVVAQFKILVGVEERRLTRVQTLFDRGAVAKGELEGQKQAVAEVKQKLKEALGDEP